VTETDDLVVQIFQENRRLRGEVDRLSTIESSRWWRLHPRLNLRRARAALRKDTPAAASGPAAATMSTKRKSGRADLRSRFREEVFERGTFSHDWFTGKIEAWETIMEALESRSARVLEIGSFEGLSACYVLWRLPDSHVTCVDTFAGSVENIVGRDLPDAGLESVFDTNVASVDASRVRKLVGDSKHVLIDLNTEGACFDFVYVDGSHHALDVLVDAALSWNMVAVDGFLVFDDYRWSAFGEDPLLRPGVAIDCFLTLVDGKYELVFRGSQLALKKIRA
jgi:hypothetical protein